MEFSLPIQFDKNSVLSKRWSLFLKRFLRYQKTSSSQDPCSNIVSVLLFAGRDQIKNICSALKIYNIDFVKLNKILEIVEQICLPNFILLFERFQFFTLELDPTEVIHETVCKISKQAEICQFGSMKDTILTEAIATSVADRKLYHHHSDTNPNVNEIGTSCSEACDKTILEDFHNSVSGGLSDDTKMDTPKVAEEEGRSQKWSGQQKQLVSKSGAYKKLTVQKTKKKDTFVEEDDCEVENPVAETEPKNVLTVPLIRSSLAGAITPYKKCKNLMCFMCGKAFAGVKWMRNHFLAHHPNCKEFSCKFCSDSWNNILDYTNHFKLHFPELERKRLRKISVVNKGKKSLSCILCSAKFMKEALLRDHVTSKHPRCKEFVCAYCGKVYNDFSQYFRHTKRVHNLYARALTCDLCQAIFFQRKRLSIHLRKHLDLRQHQCKHCGKAYNERQMLVAHLRLHSSSKCHNCQVCGKSFLALSLLTKHMRSHTGEKPYTCELCGKSYGDISAFQYHQLWHAGERPYACEICGKRTRSVGEKNKHKRVHSDKKPYVCEYCGKAFRFISNLIEHRKGHTGKRAHICDICGQSFIYRSGLTRHLQLRCPGNKNLVRNNLSSPHAAAMVNTYVGSQQKCESHNSSMAGASQGDLLTWHSMIAAYGIEEGNSGILLPQF